MNFPITIMIKIMELEIIKIKIKAIRISRINLSMKKKG